MTKRIKYLLERIIMDNWENSIADDSPIREEPNVHPEISEPEIQPNMPDDTPEIDRPL